MRSLLAVVVFCIASIASADPGEVLKKLESYRHNMPPMDQPAAVSGGSIEDAYGKKFLLVHLDQVTRRLGAKSKEDCLALLTYLKDRDPKLRIIAAQALEQIVGAHPHGMSLDDMMKPESEGHRAMVLRFVRGISAVRLRDR